MDRKPEKAQQMENNAAASPAAYRRVIYALLL